MTLVHYYIKVNGSPKLVLSSDSATKEQICDHIVCISKSHSIPINQISISLTPDSLKDTCNLLLREVRSFQECSQKV